MSEGIERGEDFLESKRRPHRIEKFPEYKLWDGASRALGAAEKRGVPDRISRAGHAEAEARKKLAAAIGWDGEEPSPSVAEMEGF
jgi:hypothetical protein